MADEFIPTLEHVLAPIDVKDFFETYYEKKPLVVRRGAPDHYADLLTLDDIDRAITSMALHDPELRMVRADATIEPQEYLFPSGLVDAAKVCQMFAEGGTVILPQLHRRIESLGAFCRAMERIFSARFQTNIYFTPGGSQGFKAHYDSHDVFVLQIAGSKTWRIYDTPVELPLMSQEFTPEVPIGEVTDTFLLEAGDMAYVPRGVTHDAVATDELSLHITTGVLVKTWTDLLAEALMDVAQNAPELRRSLPPGFSWSSFDRDPARETFQALLAKVAERASFDTALDRFADDIISTRTPLLRGQMHQILRLDEIGPETALAPRENLIYRLSEAGEALRIECYGRDIEMPSFARAAVAFALAGPRFKLADLPGGLDEDGKRVLARRLVREGLLMLA